jgi:hypothetical protein
MTGANVVKFPARLGKAEEAELRARCEALAAEYGAPLREGDAGLVEALQRLIKVGNRRSALYDEFNIDIAIERDILNAITGPPWDRLIDFIEETEPCGAAGAAVKLRYLQHIDQLDQDDEIVGRVVNQVITLLEKPSPPRA